MRKSKIRKGTGRMKKNTQEIGQNMVKPKKPSKVRTRSSDKRMSKKHKPPKSSNRGLKGRKLGKI